MVGTNDDTRALEAAQKDADMLARWIHERTGLAGSQLVCPREKSAMTPCIARDGGTSVTMAMSYGICVGCECSVASLLNAERMKRSSRVIEQIADILTEECGARLKPCTDQYCDCESFRRYIADSLAHGRGEWRISGALGFGGKIYIEKRGLRVGCYSEDETPERLAMMERANARLAELGRLPDIVAAHEEGG